MKLFGLLLIGFQIISSCNFISDRRINGNGVSSSQDRSVGDFHSINTLGAMDVILSQGPASAFKIEADENLLQYIETRNDEGKIEIYTRDGFHLESKRGIKVFASAPAFNSITVSGSGKITSNGKITSTNELNTGVSGSGDILIEVDAPSVKTHISGSGSSRIKGTTKDFSVDISGSGDVHCYDLMSEHTEIDIAGSGNAEVYASKSLDVDIAGAGDVRFRGNPTVKQSIAGSGGVKKVE